MAEKRKALLSSSLSINSIRDSVTNFSKSLRRSGILASDIAKRTRQSNIYNQNLISNKIALKKMYLKSAGSGELRAGNFETDSETEIMNPDQLIMTLDSNADIEIEANIETGKGYVSAEVAELVLPYSRQTHMRHALVHPQLQCQRVEQLRLVLDPLVPS